MSRCQFTYLDGDQCSYEVYDTEEFCTQLGHRAIADRAELDDTAYGMERDQQAADAFDREDNR